MERVRVMGLKIRATFRDARLGNTGLTSTTLLHHQHISISSLLLLPSHHHLNPDLCQHRESREMLWMNQGVYEAHIQHQPTEQTRRRKSNLI